MFDLNYPNRPFSPASIALSLLVLFFFLPSTAFAITVKCERTTSNSVGYQTQKAFDSWWPKEISLGGSEFKEAGSGSKAMVWERQGGEKNTRNRFTQKFRLLPNNLLIGEKKLYGNYASINNIRYKCDINSNELRTKLASQSESNSSSSRNSESKNNTRGCLDGNPKMCTDGQLCIRATRMAAGKRQWEYQEKWLPYVNEAKSRSLNCDVVDSSDSTSSTSKLDKAKATCNELGFTLGTEKHGECVLKMMDY